MKHVVRCVLAVLLYSLYSGAADAATIQAQSCSSTHVQAAIALANDGDTVAVPAGICTWTSMLLVTGKAITIQGAGRNLTVIIDGVPAPASGAKPPAFRWNTKPTGISRLTGFTFDGGVTGGPDQSVNT